MTRSSVFILTLSLFISTCNGQTPAVLVQEKKNSNSQYKDFAYDGDRIWGLTTDGKLALFDATSGDQIADNVKNDSAIIVLANDKEGNIVIGDKSRSIKRYEKQT